MTNKPEENRYSIRAIDRAMMVLISFDIENSEMTIGEIAQKTGIPKSTAHRIISSLIEWKMLEQNALNGKYKLGLKLFELGSIVMSKMDLRKESMPLLQELSFKYGMTLHLVIRDGNHAIYIEKIEPSDSMVRYSEVGKRVPLYCTAVGKVLLADMSTEDVERLLGRAFLPRTQYTITRFSELTECLKKVRMNGYAIDNEELELGLKCLAVPIFNHLGKVVAAISFSSSPAKLNENRIQKLVKILKDVAGKISLKLGYSESANSSWNNK